MSSWSFYTDAEPVRKHVHALRAYGIGSRQLAKLSKVSVGVINTLNQGNSHKRGIPTTKITTGAALRIMAVEAKLENVADRSTVDARITRRKMEALGAAGYSLKWIGEQIGQPKQVIYNTFKAERVYAVTARAIDRLFNDYAYTRRRSNVRNVRTSISRTLNKAKRNGWVPAAAWDNIETDARPTKTAT